MNSKVRKRAIRIVCIILAACLALSLIILPAFANENSIPLLSSYNRGDQNYIDSNRSSDIVNSYLVETDNGYMRIENIDNVVVVEYYNKNFNIIKQLTISKELDIFGGFYAGKNAYYIIFGQENPDEDDSVEVYRIVKYDTNWNCIGCSSLYGADTSIPFRSGSCRMDEYNGYLYIRTAHRTYDTNGTHYQKNMTIIVKESDMTIAETSGIGYCSHSFDQYIIIDDDGNMITLDLGDAYPRAAQLTICTQLDDSEYIDTTENKIEIMSAQGKSGTNYTGISLGGLTYSNTSYLAVGNSVLQDDLWNISDAKTGNRNIFVSVTSRNDPEESEIKWITEYDEEDETSVSVPQIVKITDDNFLLLWTITKNDSTRLNYVYLDEKGNTTSKIYDVTGALSDCQPILCGDNVVWYVTGDNANNKTVPKFYSININNNQFRITSAKNEFRFYDDDGNGSWDWASDYIYACVENDIIDGYDIGNSAYIYKIDNNLQRSEAAKLISTAFNLERGKTKYTLTDIKGNWAESYIDLCASNGIINGYTDKTFKPTDYVTRSEFVKMIAIAANLTEGQIECSFSDISSDYWAAEYIELAASNGIINGYDDGTFGPEDNITRGQAAKMIAIASGII